jgi:hypothetical protein
LATIDRTGGESYHAHSVMDIAENRVSPAGTSARWRWILAGLAAALLAAGMTVFYGVGRWLVVEDPLEKAESIAVLSGRVPVRAEEAAHLYRERYAPEVWLTHATEPGATLATMGISYAGEEDYNREVLIHGGVPDNAIHILEPPIVNTADEMGAIAWALDHSKGRVVIIVTTKAHTRRARSLWRQLARTHGRAIVRAAEADPFDPVHWWRNTSDALDVLREVLGLLNAWAGLPLHAAK